MNDVASDIRRALGSKILERLQIWRERNDKPFIAQKDYCSISYRLLAICFLGCGYTTVP